LQGLRPWPLRPQPRSKKCHELLHYTRKEEIIRTCLEYIHLAEVKGDYLEFGVWKGGSMIAAYHLSKHFSSLSSMRFYGFDSFQGIPAVTLNQAEAQHFPPGVFFADLGEVRSNLIGADVDMERVNLIPGWYSDSLNGGTRRRLPLKLAAIVNVDCDMYESAVSVLAFIEPYLADGSVIIFDDWYCFANREGWGEQKAFNEWLRKNRHLKATPYKEFGWDGKAFIINRRPASEKQKSRPESQSEESSIDNTPNAGKYLLLTWATSVLPQIL
jgi:O-methyltransferase